jgi:2-polyprenyl-3-methyl-5-hydroxy-6-metoxy-1,4-benzoquinol methylase
MADKTQNQPSPQLWYGDMYQEDKYADLRLKTYAKLLLPYLKNGIKILDIGCYTARLLDFLPKDKQIEYWGVDFDEQALVIAKQKGAKVKFVKFDTEPILLENKFDIIVAGEVLEHLINPAKILEQMQQLIKPDGVVLISLPNECTIYHRIMCLFGKGVDSLAFKLYKHLHLPTIKQNEQFVSQYFKIIKKDYFINPGGKGTRIEWFGKITKIIPDALWKTLAYISPGLFARGIILINKHITA